MYVFKKEIFDIVIFFLCILTIEIFSVYLHMSLIPDVPYCDAFPDARAGWLDNLQQDMKAPDKLGYFPPPSHLMRPVTPLGESSGTIEEEEEVGNEKASPDKND